MADEKKTVGILNLSKANRKYAVLGHEAGSKIELLPNQTTQVPDKQAAWLLGRLPNGKPRYPDLVDASKLDPRAAKAQDDAAAENKRLLKENEELRAKLAEAEKKSGEGDEDTKNDPKKSKGGK